MRRLIAPFRGACLATGVLLLSGTAVGQDTSRSIWTPPPIVSTEGHRSDELFLLVTWMLVVLFVIMAGILVVAMVKHRAGKVAHVHYHPGDTPKDAVVALVISTLIFLVVDGTLLVRSHIDLNEVYWRYPESDPDALKVEVLGQQWGWNFRYAGKDDRFNTADDIVTFNDLRVPEDKKIVMQLTSKDVIHSLFLVNTRIKQDANPGQITRMWFQTKPGAAGDYEATCAEMCGYAHYLMKSRFSILPKAEFTAWADEAARWSAIQYDKDNSDQHWGWEWQPAKAE